MYQPYIHGSQAAPRNTKRAFLLSGTAKKGYGLCYNHDIIDATAEQSTGSSTISASIATWCDARKVQVELPSVNNALHFAGVIDEASDGKVGPCWVVIHEPGSICEIYAGSIASSQITGGVAGNKVMTFCVAVNSVGAVATAFVSVGYANGAYVGPALYGAGAALLLAEGVASTYYMAELLTGRPSGGYEFITVKGEDVGQASAAAPYLIRHGVIEAYSSTGAATLSINVPAFPGAELIIKGYTGTSDIVISGNMARAAVSLENWSFAAAGVATITAAEHVELVAANTVWLVKHSTVTVT